MSDYIEKTPEAAGRIGTPAHVVRQDVPGLLPDTPTNQTLTRMQADSAGSLRVTEEGGLATYYGTSAFACDSTATDIWVFPGVAAKVAKILWLSFSSVATAAATGRVQLLRRSTADTAGTSANASIGKASSANAAAAFQPIHYTAHPTSLGTADGTIFTTQYAQQAAGTFPVMTQFIDFRARYGSQGLRIAGVAELLALNAVAGLGAAGNAWDITVCWQEPPATA